MEARDSESVRNEALSTIEETATNVESDNDSDIQSFGTTNAKSSKSDVDVESNPSPTNEEAAEGIEEVASDNKREKDSKRRLVMSICFPIGIALVLIVIICIAVLYVRKNVLSEPVVTGVQLLNGSAIPYKVGDFAREVPTFSISETYDFHSTNCKPKSRLGQEGAKIGKWQKGTNPATTTLSTGKYMFEFQYICGNKGSKTREIPVNIDTTLKDIVINSEVSTHSYFSFTIEGSDSNLSESIELSHNGESFVIPDGRSYPGWLHDVKGQLPTFSGVLTLPGEYSIKTTNSNGSTNTRSFNATFGGVEVKDEVIEPSATVEIITGELLKNKVGSQFHIGPNVTYIAPGSFGTVQISSFTLSSDNTHFVLSEYGLLLTSNAEEVVAVPPEMIGNVSVPNTARRIGDKSFFGCSLSNVVIPQSVSSIGTNAFEGCQKLNISVPGLTTTFSFAVKGNLFDPETQYLNRDMFDGKLSIDVTPSSLTKKSDGSPFEFFGQLVICSRNKPCLETTPFAISIDEPQVELEDAVALSLYHKSGASLVSFGESYVQTFVVDTLSSVLERVTIPNALKIGDAGSDIKSVKVCHKEDSGSIPSEGEYLDVTLEDSQNGDIEWECQREEGKITLCDIFSYRPGVLHLKIEDNAGNMSEQTVVVTDWVCESDATTVTVPAGLKHLSAGSFKKCQRVQTIILPSSLVSVEPNTFDELAAFNTVSIAGPSGSYNVVNNVLYKGDTLVRYPRKLVGSVFTVLGAYTSVREHAFLGCSNLTTLILDSSVTSIGVDAFKGSSITSLQILGGSILYSINEVGVTSPHSVMLYDKDFAGGNSTFSVGVILPPTSLNAATMNRMKISTDNTSIQNINQASFDVLRAPGATTKTVKVVYVDGDTKIQFINKLDIHFNVDLSSIVLSSRAVVGTELAVMFSVGTRSFRITPEGETSLDLKTDTSVATYETADNKIRFTKEGTFILSVGLSGEENIEQEIKITGSCEIPSTLQELNKENMSSRVDCGIIVIPSTVTKVAKDAMTDLGGLVAVVADITSPSNPEGCTYMSGSPAGTTGYWHVPVFRVDLSSKPKISIPEYSKFVAGREIPVLHYTEDTNESITVGTTKIVSKKVGFNFHMVPTPSTGGTLSITGGDITKTVSLVVWSESTSNYGVSGGAADGSVDLVIPYGVHKVATGQYKNNTKLLSVAFPPTLKVIEKDGFNGCQHMRTATITEGVRSIEPCSLCATSLLSLVVPGSVDTIDTAAFSANTKLVSVTLTEGLGVIGKDAFQSTNITTINLPSTVSSLGNNPFRLCSALAEITSDNSRFKTNTDKGYEFIDSEEDTLIAFLYAHPSAPTVYTVSSNITVIGAYAAYSANNLTKVKLHDGVEEIGVHSFSGCAKLVTFIMPEGITTIGDNALYNTVGLTKLTIPGSLWTGTISTSAFASSKIDNICYVGYETTTGEEEVEGEEGEEVVEEVEGVEEEEEGGVEFIGIYECSSLVGTDLTVGGKGGITATCSTVCPGVDEWST